MKITHKSCKLSTIFKRTSVDQQCIDYAEWVKWRGFDPLSSTTKNTTSELTYQIQKTKTYQIRWLIEFLISKFLLLTPQKHFIKIWGYIYVS